jgi:predicted nuclease with TOPRIM domain
MQELIDKLAKCREKLQEIETQKSRIEGQLESARQRMAELEAKCRDELKVEIAELPGYIARLEAESREKLNEAESLLFGKPGAVVNNAPIKSPVVEVAEADDEDSLFG